MKETEEKQKYYVAILRRDGNNIIATETEDFEEAHKIYKEMLKEWKRANEEKQPFEVKKPLITSFDPGMVYEITLRPFSANTKNSVNSENPYQQQMQRQGLGNMLGGGAPNMPDILDGGYKA